MKRCLSRSQCYLSSWRRGSLQPGHRPARPPPPARSRAGRRTCGSNTAIPVRAPVLLPDQPETSSVSADIASDMTASLVARCWRVPALTLAPRSSGTISPWSASTPSSRSSTTPACTGHPPHASPPPDLADGHAGAGVHTLHLSHQTCGDDHLVKHWHAASHQSRVTTLRRISS